MLRAGVSAAVAVQHRIQVGLSIPDERGNPQRLLKTCGYHLIDARRRLPHADSQCGSSMDACIVRCPAKRRVSIPLPQTHWRCARSSRVPRVRQ